VSTFAELVNEVLINLMGDSLDQNEQTFLTGPIDADELTFSVDEPAMISQGLIEINDELMWVKTVDKNSGLVTLSTLGRGYLSTTAVSHIAGSMVTNKPRYSRARVKQTVNTAIRGVYPEIYATASTEFPYVAARYAYEVPADVDQIHSLSWSTIGPSRVWEPLNQWQYIPDSDTSVFPSGKSIYLWDGIVPGRSVRVTYLKAPTVLVNDADDFSSVTGLSETAREAILYGTCYRLVGFVEAPRLQMSAVESTQRSVMVPAGSATNTGKFFYSLYLEAVARERQRLLRLNGNSTHRTRRLL